MSAFCCFLLALAISITNINSASNDNNIFQHEKKEFSQISVGSSDNAAESLYETHDERADMNFGQHSYIIQDTDICDAVSLPFQYPVVQSPGHPRTEVMAQKEDEKEGVNNDISLRINDLNVVLRQSDDSIYMSIKNKKSKRVFSQTFSKSTLQEMQLYQPIPQIIKMISAAQDNNIKQLELKIGYINTEKINKVNINNIQNNYTKGDCLCFIVKQTLEWN
eukprot:116739_1